MQGAWRGTKAQRELPEPSAPEINEINQRLRVEATTRIELVYTVLQPHKLTFAGVPEIGNSTILLLIY